MEVTTTVTYNRVFEGNSAEVANIVTQMTNEITSDPTMVITNISVYPVNHEEPDGNKWDISISAQRTLKVE